MTASEQAAADACAAARETSDRRSEGHGADRHPEDLTAPLPRSVPENYRDPSRVGGAIDVIVWRTRCPKAETGEDVRRAG
jgi:hypothetical protein